MNTKDVGDRSEAMVLAALLRAGKVVLQPFGDNQRYDLVIDDSGVFKRIQVKTGRLKNGVVKADTCSRNYQRGGKRKGYSGQIEFFAIYCPDNDQIYMVPVEAAPGVEVSLRIDPPKNNQAVRWANDFLLGSTIGRAASC